MINKNSTELNINFTQFSKEVLFHINNIRESPRSYIPKLLKIKTLMLNSTDLQTIRIGSIEKREYKFTEGVNIINETISFLYSLNELKLKKVTESNELSNFCKSSLNHIVINPSVLIETEEEIVNRLKKSLLINCEIAYLNTIGIFKSELLVLCYAICDGDIERTNRIKLFSPLFNYIGISSNILTNGKIVSYIILVEDITKHYKKISNDNYFELNKPSPKNVISIEQTIDTSIINNNYKLNLANLMNTKDKVDDLQLNKNNNSDTILKNTTKSKDKKEIKKQIKFDM